MSIASVSGRNRAARLVTQSKPDLSPYRATYSFPTKQWLVVTRFAGDTVCVCQTFQEAVAAETRLNNGEPA